MKRAGARLVEPTFETMPVFAVADEVAEVVISAEPRKRVKSVKQSKTRASRPQRIGTAYTLSDGSIGVQLTVVPRNGKLVVRMLRARRGSGRAASVR